MIELLSVGFTDLMEYFHSKVEPDRVRTPLSTSLERYVETVLRGTSSP